MATPFGINPGRYNGRGGYLSPRDLEVITGIPATWSLLEGLPLLTINPTGSVDAPNLGASFGPQTLQGATGPGQYGPPYSSSSGLQEYLNTLPTSGQDQTSMYEGFLLPGALGVATSILTINASNLVLMGSGKNSSSVKWTGSSTLPVTSFGGPGWSASPAGAPPYSSSVFWYFPNSNNSGATGSNTAGEGTYLGHFALDLNGKAWNYGLCIGNPGGNIPDICAAALLLEHLRMQGDGGIGGINTSIDGPNYGTTGSPAYLPLYNSELVLSSYEDALLLHCAVGGAPVEWIVNNGSAKIIGGNIGKYSSSTGQQPLVAPCLNMSITDAVLAVVVSGNAGASGGVVAGQLANLYIDGVGFNGAAVPNIQVVPMNASVNKYFRATLNGVDMNVEANATTDSTNVGWFGPYISGNLTGLALTMAYLAECHIVSGATTQQTFFAPGGNGWATLTNCHLSGGSSQNMPGFLGSGSFINGNLLDRSAVMWQFLNGFTVPQGLISYPFGAGVPTWGGSSGNIMGPGFTSGTGTAAPVSGDVYTVAYNNLQFFITGGTISVLAIRDQNGNSIIPSGTTSLPYPGVRLCPGFTVEVAYTGSPVFTVIGLT